MVLPLLTMFTATLPWTSSWTELFYTTLGIQNALQLLCTHDRFYLLPNTAAGFYHDEHDSKLKKCNYVLDIKHQTLGNSQY